MEYNYETMTDAEILEDSDACFSFEEIKTNDSSLYKIPSIAQINHQTSEMVKFISNNKKSDIVKTKLKNIINTYKKFRLNDEITFFELYIEACSNISCYDTDADTDDADTDDADTDDVNPTVKCVSYNHNGDIYYFSYEHVKLLKKFVERGFSRIELGTHKKNIGNSKYGCIIFR
jgi:hypothetical protein